MFYIYLIDIKRIYNKLAQLHPYAYVCYRHKKTAIKLIAVFLIEMNIYQILTCLSVGKNILSPSLTL